MALKVAVNVPAGAELEVSVTVVDALAPGLSVSDELPNAALHPLGDSGFLAASTDGGFRTATTPTPS